MAFRIADETPAASPAPAAQLAILPLSAIGNLPAGDEHLGVAIADSIITRLATVRRIGLRPTTAVLSYANTPADPMQVARALAVDYLLTGTIQQGSSTYRVTFQLVQGTGGAVTWGRTYDVIRSGLRDFQDSVAEQIVDVLRLELGPDERDRLRRHYTDKVDAYEQYLKGRASLLNYTEAGMKEAIAAFERAVAIDPEYALARAGLAVATAWFSIRYAYQTEAFQWGARADSEARAALVADPLLAEARLAMAGAAGTLYGGFNWPSVIDDATRALEIDPTLELAHVVLMRAYFHFGLFNRMVAEAEIAHRMNPLGNVEVSRLEVAASLFAGAYDRARDQAAALLARSDAPVIRNYLGLAQFYAGDWRVRIGPWRRCSGVAAPMFVRRPRSRASRRPRATASPVAPAPWASNVGLTWTTTSPTAWAPRGRSSATQPQPSSGCNRLPIADFRAFRPSSVTRCWTRSGNISSSRLCWNDCASASSAMPPDTAGRSSGPTHIRPLTQRHQQTR